MGDLAFLTLEAKTYTPDEVWALVDAIPNGPSTHWKVFGERVLPAIQNLLLERHPVEAEEIALAWAERSPKFDQKAFDQRWRALQRSPMVMPGLHTLQELAQQASEASGDPLRAQWDALRQACAVIAGKIRASALVRFKDEARASGQGLVSCVTGLPLPPQDAVVAYTGGWGLDGVVLEFCAGVQRKPGEFDLHRVDGGGHRFARDEDAQLFAACHREVAQLAIARKAEAVMMNKAADWGAVRAALAAI